jgi:hypothetical protein
MSSNTKDTVIGAIAAIIGSAIGAGVVQYATNKEFKNWVNNNLYPAAKKIVVRFSPHTIKAAKEKIESKYINKPIVKDVLLELMDFFIEGIVKFDEMFEKRLFESRQYLPEVHKELIAIEEQ